MGCKRCLYNRWYFSLSKGNRNPQITLFETFFSVCQIWVPFFWGHTNIIPYRHIYPNFGWLTSDICASGTSPMAWRPLVCILTCRLIYFVVKQHGYRQSTHLQIIYSFNIVFSMFMEVCWRVFLMNARMFSTSCVYFMVKIRVLIGMVYNTRGCKSKLGIQ